jgi:hypothetical protein
MNKIVFLSFILVQIAVGGFERTEVGARAAGFANAFSGLANDVTGISFNPAGIADIKHIQGAFFYSPQPFGLSELALGSVNVAVPLNIGVVGVSLRCYGFDLYREISGTISFSRIVADIQVGLNLHYDALRIKNYGSEGTFGIDAGFIIPLQKNLHCGLAVHNLNAPTVGSRRESLPRVFTSGFAYSPISNLTLLLDIQKEISFLPSTRFGFEYWMFNAIAFRAGVSEKPTQFSTGIGVRYRLIQFDYAVSVHQELGWTHSFSVTVL